MLASDWSRAKQWRHDRNRKSRVFRMGNRWPGGKNDRGLKQPEVTCFRMGNRRAGGKKDRGLRVGKNRWETRAQSPKSNLSSGGRYKKAITGVRWWLLTPWVSTSPLSVIKHKARDKNLPLDFLIPIIWWKMIGKRPWFISHTLVFINHWCKYF